ncbi:MULTISPECIES: S1 family peptidase [Calothrix]|uniref:Trypsin-like peptidase domain-containing protein n=2 Tax=Calothrix TaxID=1186 RepID=A0ABR8ACN1_9CYAN|nr:MULTISPECIES: serine protease [Calothrix]MBD2197653.1 trypsin-like peptidase domain-containing protein [Calothrix parietina FACHB-288]MBD2225582.1 trypsin-like peptidase domain-containing protein [Calothrix anomala FACHB-343]
MNFSFSRFNSVPGLLTGTAVVAAIVINQPASAKTAKEVAQIAVPTTVRIDNSLGSNYGGSGVIISRDGNTYTVLTANHVVKSANTEYSIRTSKNKTHNVISVQNLQRNDSDPDLAIVKFESTEEYPVAPISNSDNAGIGTGIYISGYPMSIENNNDREYEFTKGQITSRPESKPQGYTMRYDAVTRRGMSGGPVFDVSGRVVGIHGQGDRDGVIKNESATGGEIEIKTGFNAAVPINTFKEVISQSGVQVAFQEDNSQAENVEATQPTKAEVRSWAQDFAAGVVNTIIERVIPRFW